jgi:hypothetical protein
MLTERHLVDVGDGGGGRDDLLFSYPPKRATMVAASFYVYAPLDWLVHRLCPGYDPMVLAMERFIFSYCVAAHADDYLWEKAHVLVLPMAGYLCGLWECRVTSWPRVNFAVTMVIFGAIAPYASHEPLVFVACAYLFVFLNWVTRPTIYDVSLSALVSLVLVTLGIVFQASQFKDEHEGTALYLLVFQVQLAFLLRSTGVVDDKDSDTLWAIRWTMHKVSYFTWWALLSTVLYFGLGIHLVVHIIGKHHHLQ